MTVRQRPSIVRSSLRTDSVGRRQSGVWDTIGEVEVLIPRHPPLKAGPIPASHSSKLQVNIKVCIDHHDSSRWLFESTKS